MSRNLARKATLLVAARIRIAIAGSLREKPREGLKDANDKLPKDQI